MGESTRKRSGRIEARITRQQKRLFERAAAIEGRTLTDFVLSSAQAAAERTIERQHVMRLSERDARIFVEALLNPPKPNRALRAAVAKYKLAQSRRGE